MNPELEELIASGLLAVPDATRVAPRTDPDPPSFFRRARQGALGLSRGVSDLSVAGSRGLVDYARRLGGEFADDPAQAYQNYLRGGLSSVLDLARFIPGESAPERMLRAGAERIAPDDPEAAHGQLGSFVGTILPDLVGADIPLIPGRMSEAESWLGKALEASAGLPLVPGAMLQARHFGSRVRNLDVLDPAFGGAGVKGEEARRKAAFPDEYEDRTYFYIGDRQPEPGLRAKPFVELDLPVEKFANPEQFQPFVRQAEEQLAAEGRAAVPDLVMSRAERLLKASDEFEGYYDPDQGVLVKFTRTELPYGATGKGVRSVAKQAQQYVELARGTGRQIDPHPESFEYAPVSEERGRRIADTYEALPHDPQNPQVAASYQAMADETKDQYNFLSEQGVRFEPATDDPYASSAEMIADVRDNKRLKFFLTDLDDFPADHPLAEPSGVFMDMPDGTRREMVYNDLFRAVHDYFGHAAEGFQFGPRGEDNAWRMHAAMYSPEARPAMSFETRGQNSWVNFGPQMRGADGQLLKKGDEGYLSPQEQSFADQKANILPDEFTDAGPDGATLEGTQSPLQYLGDLGAPTDLPPRETARAAAGARLRRDNRTPTSRARRTQAIEAGLTPDELERFRGLNSNTRSTIEKNYSRLPDPEIFAQAAIRGAESRGWYLGSGNAIRESFGTEAPRFTALLAAMSPQKSVEENLRIALNTWGDWNRAGRPTDEAGLRAVIDSNLEADIGNAMRSLRATDEEVAAGVPSLLNGPKVGPFYANLIGVVEPVVNDTHMARGYGTLPEGVGTVGRTLAQNAMVRNAAVEFERLTGQVVEPRELQEMSWAFIRGLTNAAGSKGKALETIEAAILKPETAFSGGQKLDERVRNSVSIGHLMAQPEFAASLERAGVRAPTPQAPHGTAGVDPLSADPNALRDIAERIDLVRSGRPLYNLAPLLAGAGVGSLGVARTNRNQRENVSVHERLGVRSASDRLRGR